MEPRQRLQWRRLNNADDVLGLGGRLDSTPDDSLDGIRFRPPCGRTCDQVADHVQREVGSI
jgi:hypothetical protein